MSCKNVSDLLPLFDDPELGAEERAAVASHVAVCPTCAQELDSIRRAQHRLAFLRTVDVPAYGPERVIARIHERRTFGPLAKVGRLLTARPYWAGTLVAGLFAVIVWSALPTAPGADEPSMSEAPITMMFAQEDAAPFTAMRMMATEPEGFEARTIDLESPDPAALAQLLAAEFEQVTDLAAVITELGDGSIRVEVDGATLAAANEVLLAVEARRGASGFVYDATTLGSTDAQQPTRVILHLYPAGRSN